MIGKCALYALLAMIFSKIWGVLLCPMGKFKARSPDFMAVIRSNI